MDCVAGEVTIQENCCIWYNTVIRGDLNAVVIGEGSSIGDNTTIHTLASLGIGLMAATTIGKYVIIGSHCSLCSCIVEDECYIGPGCTILEGARLEKGSMITAGSVVPPGRLIPAGQVWAGNPVEYVRTMNHAELSANYTFSYIHSDLGHAHKGCFAHIPNAYLLKATTQEDLTITSDKMVDYSLGEPESIIPTKYP